MYLLTLLREEGDMYRRFALFWFVVNVFCEVMVRLKSP